MPSLRKIAEQTLYEAGDQAEAFRELESGHIFSFSGHYDQGYFKQRELAERWTLIKRYPENAASRHPNRFGMKRMGGFL